MTQKRKIIVHIATSADGYIARPNGNLDWLTSRPAPKGFYGLPKFAQSIDAKILGRTTFDLSVKMGASFSPDDVHYVFSRRPAPAAIPAGVHFVKEPISAFAERLRKQAGKNVWMMGGGEIMAPSLTRTLLMSSSLASYRPLLEKAFPSLHRGIVKYRCACAPRSPSLMEWYSSTTLSPLSVAQK